MIRITFPGIQPSTDVAKWQQPSHLAYLTLFIGEAARLIGLLVVATLPETLLLSDRVCQESPALSLTGFLAILFHTCGSLLPEEKGSGIRSPHEFIPMRSVQAITLIHSAESARTAHHAISK